MAPLLMSLAILFGCEDAELNDNEWDPCNIDCNDLAPFIRLSSTSASGDSETTIDTAFVISQAAHTLHLNIRYGGGCKTHCFGINYDFYEKTDTTLPVFLFRLNHFGNCDYCKAIVLQELTFDMDSLIQMYDSLGLLSPADSVEIIIADYNPAIAFQL